MSEADDARLVYPATARNRDAIASVLNRVLPAEGRVLEVASGSGEHVVHFAAELPHLVFQPSDPSERARSSIAAWTTEARRTNVRPPLALDTEADGWDHALADRPNAIFSANMIHIAPWSACEGLMAGAGRLLARGEPLVLYGPFRRDGRHTAASNEAFDASLRERDPRWGVRDLADVGNQAARHGLVLDEIVELPANNACVVFRRGPDPDVRETAGRR